MNRLCARFEDLHKYVSSLHVSCLQARTTPGHTCDLFVCFYRINFSLEELVPVSTYYEHFRHCLESVYPFGKKELKFHAQQICSDFAQHCSYDRVKELVRNHLAYAHIIENVDLSMIYSRNCGN